MARVKPWRAWPRPWILRQELLAALAGVAGAVLQNRILRGAPISRYGGDWSLGRATGFEEIVSRRGGRRRRCRGGRGGGSRGGGRCRCRRRRGGRRGGDNGRGGLLRFDRGWRIPRGQQRESGGQERQNHHGQLQRGPRPLRHISPCTSLLYDNYSASARLSPQTSPCRMRQ